MTDALIHIRTLLRNWKYNTYLNSITLAGSHAKGTDLKDSDYDIFLNLSAATPGPIAAIQHSLWQALLPKYQPVIRNVSVRIVLDVAAEKPGLPTRSRAPLDSNMQSAISLRADRAGCPSVFQPHSTGISVDLVPARANILWQARFNTWLKTDIEKQIRYVRDSGCIDEILALKIWRRRHALRFPSFLMELATIHALSRTQGDCPPISKNEHSMTRNSTPKSAGCPRDVEIGDCLPVSKNEPCKNRNSTPKSAGFGETGDCPPISKNERCMNRNSSPKSAGCPLGISQSLPALLHFLATDFPTTRLLDPANSNNVVSDLLTDVEKLRIARRAAISLGIPFQPRP